MRFAAHEGRFATLEAAFVLKEIADLHRIQPNHTLSFSPRLAVTITFRFLPLRLLPGLVVVALHKPVEIGRDVEALRHFVQQD